MKVEKLKGNKGEWNELYVLLKIIADQCLYAGDSELNKMENLIFPIIKILRDETSGKFQFSYDGDLVIIQKDKEIFRLPIKRFEEQSKILLTKLQEKTTTTFYIEELENFIHSFGSNSIKAKSSIKSDIKIIIHDPITGFNPELGFSIKSQLGSPSTLLNAGKTTNFIYEVKNFHPDDKTLNYINSINSKTKIKDRLKNIYLQGGKLEYICTENKVFNNNLTLIDSCLPLIVAELLKISYSSSLSNISQLITKLEKKNPANFDVTSYHPFYAYKIKKFLMDVALGMMPGSVWTGELDATGGYLIVKGNGDVLCYHIYNKNKFEDYLFYNTRLETASSTRHDFGKLYYGEDKRLFFKLNLQIRFL